MRHWNWDGMVDGYRGKLVRLLAGLFALLGSGPVVRRALWRRILETLVPIESSVRRLVCILARDLSVTLPPARKGEAGARRRAGRGKDRKPLFALTDALRNPDPPPRTCPERNAPRISSLDDWTPREAVPMPADDDPLDAEALRRRMQAVRDALADLSAQAMRLARWNARNERAREDGAWRRVHPMRSGRPPGYRARNRRKAHTLLAECHDLAVRCLRMLEKEAYG